MRWQVTVSVSDMDASVTYEAEAETLIGVYHTLVSPALAAFERAAPEAGDVTASRPGRSVTVTVAPAE